jgi:hypothetical protein
VGHSPASSPYRDIEGRSGPVFAISHWAGAGGKLDIGVTDALVGSVAFELKIGGGPLRVRAGISYGRGERFVLDPTKNANERRSGPFDDSFLLPEIEGQLSITGNKTWHGFAPYLLANVGFILGGMEPAADTSDYEMGNKLMYAPGIGLRWYPTGRLSLQLDARLVSIKLEYPDQFYVPAADGTAVLAFSEASEEWTRFARIRVGVGWTF